MSSELHKQIDKLLENEIVDRHSMFQLKYFVVGKEPTTQAKMWRCLKELQSRKQAMEAMKLEIEDVNDRKELLALEIDKLKLIKPNPGSDVVTEKQLIEKENAIKTRQINRQIGNLEKSLIELQRKLKFAEEEADFFVKAFASLSEHEKLKPYDDLEAQTDYWNEKLSQELNLRLLLQNPVDSELVNTILALNNEAQVKQQTIHMIEKMQSKAIEQKTPPNKLPESAGE